MKNLVTLICLLIFIGFSQQPAEAKPRHIAKRCVWTPLKWAGIVLASPGLLVSTVGVVGEACCNEADRIDAAKAEVDKAIEQMKNALPELQKSTEEAAARREQNRLIYEAEEKKLAEEDAKEVEQ